MDGTPYAAPWTSNKALTMFTISNVLKNTWFQIYVKFWEIWKKSENYSLVFPTEFPGH